MSKRKFLDDYVEIADIHIYRLKAGINNTKSLFPINKSILENVSDGEVAFLDMMTTRFGKLQDLIAAKIFPLILDLLGENVSSVKDNLNKLEKLEYINNANWWMHIRELRNQLTHDYPNEYIMLSEHLNELIVDIKKLIEEWNYIKNKISKIY